MFICYCVFYNIAKHKYVSDFNYTVGSQVHGTFQMYSMHSRDPHIKRTHDQQVKVHQNGHTLFVATRFSSFLFFFSFKLHVHAT